MSNYPEHNFPAFEFAAKALRAQGYSVVSPHETEAIDHDAPKQWDYYVRKDIVAMMACDHIVRLPGWEASKGATLELTIATALGFIVADFVDGKIVPLAG